MKLALESVCREPCVMAEWLLSTEETQEEAEPAEPPDRTELVPRLSNSEVLRGLRNFCELYLQYIPCG